MRTTKTDRTGARSARQVHQSSWTEYLESETARMDTLGLRSGLISVTLGDPDVDAGQYSVARDRALRLLIHTISPTSRLAPTSARSIAVLEAPLTSLHDLERHARSISTRLAVAGLTAAVGYAHRRSDEPLLDTWARSDAEADRAAFRLHHPEGGLRLR